MRRLSTTSYALLGLLASQDSTAYALLQQMKRSLGYIWPRAASGIYLEPRALQAHGLVDATDDPSKRTRGRYRITDRGREALAAWITTPSAPSMFESENALKLIFANVSTKAHAIGLIDDIAADARQHTGELLDVLADYGAGHGSHPDRAHVVALTSRLYLEHYAAMIRWSEWARAEINRWPAIDHTAAHLARAIIIDSCQQFAADVPPRRRPMAG